MNRLFPIVANEWYHVYNRGNNRRTLFHHPSDYRLFMAKMDHACMEYGVDRIAFALMPNHFHAILVQPVGGSLPRMMDSIGTSYARYYNFKYHHVGHVFQGRYRYRHIPTDDLLRAVARYIHLNPIRAGFVSRAEDWVFSDFRQLKEEGISQGGSSVDRGRRLLCSGEYASFVRSGVEEIEVLRDFLFGSAGEVQGVLQLPHG